MEKSSFFNSVSGDRKYKAEDWASYFGSFIGNGVFPVPSTGLQVVAGSGMQVTVKAGKAWINGYFYNNTSDLSLTLATADGVLNRIDRIVVRWDLTNRVISVKAKSSSYSASPNVLEPILTRSFITDNYASQVGKGTHYGLDRLQEFLRRFYRKNGIDGWILKADISKYFYSIRHDVLKTLIRRKITDPDVLWLVDMIIDSTEGNVGIPIGNQSSQLFALLYLNNLDHFVKEKLGIKYYGRYMDDFFLIHEDKAYLQYCRAEIEKHVAAIGLSLNNKTNIYPLRNGIDFLGFHTYLTETGAVIRKVRRRSKNNMKRKLKKMRGLVERGKITTATVEQSYKSWRGHAEKGNCYHLIRRTDHYYNRLFNSKEAEKCQKH